MWDQSEVITLLIEMGVVGLAALLYIIGAARR